MTPTRPPRIWTLTDDRAGNVHQAQALARAIGDVDRHISVRFPIPWRWLAPHVLPGAWRGLRLATDQLPDIAIGCGRQAALALRALKQKRDVFTVQILDPRVDPAHFDLVIAPQHDELTGSNVLVTIGALNAIDEVWMQKSRDEFPEIGKLPRPLVALMIGGPHRDAPLSDAALEKVLERLGQETDALGGTLLVCGSRRTPPQWRPLIRARALQLGARVWMDEHDGINPYKGFLAHADRLIVSADSVNMLSEACATGVPVAGYSDGPLSGKLLRLNNTLNRAGLLSPFDTPARPPEPLRETVRIAAQVLQQWHNQAIPR